MSAKAPALCCARSRVVGLRPGSVLGVDRSPEMLARVRALPADWRLLHADATRLPLADSSIDVVIASFLLHLLSDRKRVACLRELRRVLTPDGRLVIVVPAYPADPLGRASYQLLLHALNIVPGGIARTLQPIELEPDLQTTGFTITTTRRSHRGYPATCLLTRPTASPPHAIVPASHGVKSGSRTARAAPRGRSTNSFAACEGLRGGVGRSERFADIASVCGEVGRRG